MTAREFVGELTRALRAIRWFALLTLAGCLISAPVAESYGQRAGVTVAAIYLLTVVALVARRAARRRAERPPRHRFDQRAVLAAVYGPASDELLSVREMCAAAVICAVHLGLTDKQIARRLDCALPDVAILLGVVPPPQRGRRRVGRVGHGVPLWVLPHPPGPRSFSHT